MSDRIFLDTNVLVYALLENDCSILYSEDMQNGQIIEGKLKISNPFGVETLE